MVAPTETMIHINGGAGEPFLGRLGINKPALTVDFGAQAP